MPVTGACFVLGAVAISGLPPLNGFTSEWLLYRGLIGLALGSTATAGVVATLAAALLALVGGLAAACFVRLVGIAFLGEPRSPEARLAHEGGPLLWGPALLLAAACVALALFPGGVVRLAQPVAAQLFGPTLASAGAVQETVAALTPIGVAAGIGWAVVVAGAGLVTARMGARSRRTVETWACGYAQPSARMQYTARSFSELLAERLLPRWLAPRVRVSALRGSFPAPAALVERGARSDHARRLRAALHRARHPLRALARPPAGQCAPLSHLHPQRGPRRSRLDLATDAMGAMSATLALVAVALAAVSGLPGLVLPRDHVAADRSAALLLALAALCAVAATVSIVSGAPEQTLALPWLVLGERVERRTRRTLGLLPPAHARHLERRQPLCGRLLAGPRPLRVARGACAWRSGSSRAAPAWS